LNIINSNNNNYNAFTAILFAMLLFNRSAEPAIYYSGHYGTKESDVF